MKIELKKIRIRELVEGYVDNTEEGVLGYGGKLNIRPPYQREFVYNNEQRDAVIDTIKKDFPLNIMYWAVKDGENFEIIDGQQRTVSICKYATGKFSFNKLFIHNLQDDEQKQILDYELTVYLCSGKDSEKLKWFETINIVGEELTHQELRNAVYSGSWVSDAKRYFSKTGCVGSNLASDYVSGSPLRQELFEIAIKWIKDDKTKIEDYMAKNQHNQNANELWQHFQAVINWVKITFKTRKTIMKTVDWGTLYNQYKGNLFDTDKIESDTQKLILDDDVTKKSGIYPYILTRKEKHLSIRAFTDNMKQKVYEKQAGNCKKCKKHFELSEMEADHITPWHEGGKTIEDNCQLLCKSENRGKSGK